MFANTTQFAEHLARRARLGVVEAKPVVSRRYVARAAYQPPPEVRATIDMSTYSVPTFSVQVANNLSGFDVFENIEVINSRWREIIKEVCVKHEVPILAVRGNHRSRDIVRARHEVFYRLRTETGLSYTSIAKKVGNFDHTTAISGYNSHVRRMKKQALEGMNK